MTDLGRTLARARRDFRGIVALIGPRCREQARPLGVGAGAGGLHELYLNFKNPYLFMQFYPRDKGTAGKMIFYIADGQVGHIVARLHGIAGDMGQ